MNKKRNRIIIAVVLIVLTICFVFLLNKCTGESPDNVMLPAASGEPWDRENVNGNGNSEEGQAYISIPGYSKLFASQEKPDISLVNPSENTVYFQYAIYEGGQLIHETELIEPGDMLRWDAYSVFESGEYAIEIKILTYDLDSQAGCNGATMPATLHVSA